MKTFPMFLRMSGRRAVIVGGGEQAAQKCRLLLKTEARIVVCADVLDPELAQLARAGRIARQASAFDADMFKDAALVFVATGCAGADVAAAALARAAGAVVNVVDRPDLCDAFTPSIVDRDPLVVAIGTEGAAPVLGRQIKTKIEEMLEPRLGVLVALAGRLRDAVAERVPPARRRAFWAWAFSGKPRRLHAAGAEAHAAQALKAAIGEGGAPAIDQERGLVSLVGAGPGARDLLTLRAVQRLQEADVVFYDRLVDPDALELARRDAERVFVGKAPGGRSWPQDKICGVVVAAARAGKRVVRLKSGDPLVFGRAAEEVAACDAAGVDCEIVPGVTAAFAAAAQAKLFPTERGVAHRLVLASGRRADGVPIHTAALGLEPGSTVAMYMGVAEGPRIAGDLLAGGGDPDLPVTIVERAETADARTISATLSTLTAALDEQSVANPAIVFFGPTAQRAAVAAAPRLTAKATIPA